VGPDEVWFPWLQEDAQIQALAALLDSALQALLLEALLGVPILPLGLPDVRLVLSDAMLLLQRRPAQLTVSLPFPPLTLRPRRMLLQRTALLLCSSPHLALFQAQRPQRAQAPLLLAC
jgi:hypothetical protein